jgi:DNA-binding NarL/FixJ family response regulator
MAKIVLVDDHTLLRNGLAGLIESLGHKILFEANHGKEFIQKLEHSRELPDMVLLDINMPEMDGYETANWIKKNKPAVAMLALSMYDNETAILRMLRNGASGYILKDAHPNELKMAIEAILNKGFYHSELISGKSYMPFPGRRMTRVICSRPMNSPIKNIIFYNLPAVS